MHIKYDPIFAFEIIHFYSTAYDEIYPGISAWKPGEVKRIPDDLKIRMSIRSNEYYPKLVDVLLTSPDFKIVDGDTIVNPNFQCFRCGNAARDEMIIHPKSGCGIPLEIDGNSVCKACWDRAPKNLTASGYEFISEGQ